MRRLSILIVVVFSLSFCSKDQPADTSMQKPVAKAVKNEKSEKPGKIADIVQKEEAQVGEQKQETLIKQDRSAVGDETPVKEDLVPVEIPSWEIKEAGKKVDKIIDDLESKEEFSKELQQLEALGKPASPRLAQYFADTKVEWQKRWLAAMGLGRTRGPGAKNALLKGLDDKLSVMKMASAIALKHYPDSDVVDKLHEVFKNDKGMLVRNTIIDTLVEIGDPRSVTVLASGLTNDENFYRGRNLWIRNNIVYAMGKFKDKKAVPHLIEILNKNDESLRDIALKSLEYIVEPSGQEEIASLSEKKKKVKWWLSWWDKNKRDYL